MMTECGGLCIHQESLQVKVIRASVIEGSVGSTMCLFGTHPGHLLWMEKGKLYSSDLRTDQVCWWYALGISMQHCILLQLPLQAMTPAVQVGEGNVEVMCIGSGGQPFHVLVATKKELLVLDIRQPAEPLLTVSHHLTHPVTRLHAVQDTASIHYRFRISLCLLTVSSLTLC